MFTAFQVISLTLLIFIMTYDYYDTQIFIFGSPVICGFFTGLIMGDLQTGLMVGATLQLMSLGVGGYGGSSVPDYTIGTIIGAAFAISTNGGLNSGLAVGIPTAALGVQLDVVGKMAGSFFYHKALASSQKLDLKKTYAWIVSGVIPKCIFKCLLVIIATTAGSTAIKALLELMPQWLTNGLTVAGGILPAVGFAILLRYMPLKKHFVYAMLGFVLASYLKFTMIAVAIVGFIIAYIIFQKNEKMSKMNTATAMAGQAQEGTYDE